MSPTIASHQTRFKLMYNWCTTTVERLSVPDAEMLIPSIRNTRKGKAPLAAMEIIDDFIAGMRRLASGVSVVTAVATDGTPCGITATAVFSLSVEPPSLVVGVNKGSRLGEILPGAANFAVSILGVRHRHVAEAFAGKVSGLWGPTRFAYGTWRYDGEGVPILDDAPACFVCKIDDIIDRSTHLLLIGTVTDVHLVDQDAALLVHYSRRFTGLGVPGAAGFH